MNVLLKFSVFGLLMSFLLQISQAATVTVEDPTKPTVLFKISKPGHQDSYLFGTIHMMPVDKFIIKPKVQKALDESKTLVMELSLDELEDPSKLMSLMSMINMKGDTTLSDLLTEEELSKINKFCDEKGLPFFMINRMKPFFSAILLAQMTGDLSEEYKGYELEFWQMAKSEQKEISSLESTEEQMAIFDNIPYADQTTYMMSVVNGESTSQELDKLVDAYLTEDLEQINKFVSGEDPLLGDYGDVLLIERNKNWIPKIETFTKNSKCFIAVGAGHLGGEYGLLTLLEKHGYTIESILD